MMNDTHSFLFILFENNLQVSDYLLIIKKTEEVAKKVFCVLCS